MVVNATRLKTVITVARVVKLLCAYDRGIGPARLRAHGIAPEVASPIDIHSINVGCSQNSAMSVTAVAIPSRHDPGLCSGQGTDLNDDNPYLWPDLVDWPPDVPGTGRLDTHSRIRGRHQLGCRCSAVSRHQAL